MGVVIHVKISFVFSRNPAQLTAGKFPLTSDLSIPQGHAARGPTSTDYIMEEMTATALSCVRFIIVELYCADICSTSG